MPLQLDTPDFNELFRQTPFPIILNDVPYLTKEDRDRFTAMLLTTYDTDTLSTVPICSCGHLEGGYNLGRQCPVCHTVVSLPSEGEIDLRTWIRVPEGVDGFILPVVYVQLNNLISGTGFNILEFILNTRSKLPAKLHKTVAKKLEILEKGGIERGLNNFIRNFDLVLNVLPSLAGIKGVEYASHLIKIQDRIFPQYLPMPTKAMLILETTHLGAYADNDSITGAIDAARTIASLSVPKQRPNSIPALESKIVGVIQNLAQYYMMTIKSGYSSKKGWFRGQLFSSRSHWCMRAVATSIFGPHHYQELHIPWSSGLELLKIHLVSKLIHKLDYDVRKAYALVENSGNVYDKLLDQLMQELIAEAPKINYNLEEDLDYYRWLGLDEEQIKLVKRPESGLKAICQRNPSLDELSAQLCYITKVKTDLTDKTLSLSVITLKGYNADFDGDEMNVTLAVTKESIDALDNLNSYYGIHDSVNLKGFRDILSLPQVTVSTMNNYLIHN